MIITEEQAKILGYKKYSFSYYPAPTPGNIVIDNWQSESPIPDSDTINSWKQEYVLGEKWNTVRLKRNMLLKNSDWTQMPDYNGSNKQAWFNYRQELRDLPQKFSNPDDVIWPNEPNS
ncbi:MAG: hypothetical protein EBU90_25185 [Proteobacteria bacterium]|nr:hypothetical protein [Pseudomonadota bacterium]NBP16498.1 hypothetical protein [bacterium]